MQDEAKSKAKEMADSIIQDAKKVIDTEKQKALSEIKTTVVDIALKASERVIKRNLNNEDNKKMIEDTIDQLKQSN